MFELTSEQKKEIKASVASVIAMIRKAVGDNNELVSDAEILNIASVQYKDALVAFVEGWLACKGMYPAECGITVQDIIDSL